MLCLMGVGLVFEADLATPVCSSHFQISTKYFLKCWVHSASMTAFPELEFYSRDQNHWRIFSEGTTHHSSHWVLQGCAFDSVSVFSSQSWSDITSRPNLRFILILKSQGAEFVSGSNLNESHALNAGRRWYWRWTSITDRSMYLSQSMFIKIETRNRTSQIVFSLIHPDSRHAVRNQSNTSINGRVGDT